MTELVGMLEKVQEKNWSHELVSEFLKFAINERGQVSAIGPIVVVQSIMLGWARGLCRTLRRMVWCMVLDLPHILKRKHIRNF
jgi:hypothetical protein